MPVMQKCEEVHPDELNQCYGPDAENCQNYEPEEDSDDEFPLCSHCLVCSSRGYCELTGDEEP